MSSKVNKLNIHIEAIENGYIVRDITRTKAEHSEGEPKIYIAMDVQSLKNKISDLIDEHLVKVGEGKSVSHTCDDVLDGWRSSHPLPNPAQ